MGNLIRLATVQQLRLHRRPATQTIKYDAYYAIQLPEKQMNAKLNLNAKYHGLRNRSLAMLAGGDIAGVTMPLDMTRFDLPQQDYTTPYFTLPW
jgi:hypothetical protein